MTAVGRTDTDHLTLRAEADARRQVPKVEGAATPVFEAIGAEAKSRFTGRIPKVTLEVR